MSASINLNPIRIPMKPNQIEVKFDQPEPFALAVQETQDGERIALTKKKREADRAESEKQQTTLV